MKFLKTKVFLLLFGCCGEVVFISVCEGERDSVGLRDGLNEEECGRKEDKEDGMQNRGKIGAK